MFNRPLYLTHVGLECIAPGAPYPQEDALPYDFNWSDGRILPEFCLALALAGKGEIRIKNQRDVLMPGSVFFVCPGQWHSHRPDPRTGWTLTWIAFNGVQPLTWLRENAFNVTGALPVIENLSLFRSQFEHIVACARLGHEHLANAAWLTIGLLAHFLHTPPDTANASGPRQVKDDVVRAAIEYIWNFSHGYLDVPTIASKVGVARRTLDVRFRSASGRSVLEEIQHCRLTRAAMLLRETDLPIYIIVQRSGFHSEEHLRVACHKTYGLSPQAYRQRAKAQSMCPCSLAGGADPAPADRSSIR